VRRNFLLLTSIEIDMKLDLLKRLSTVSAAVVITSACLAQAPAAETPGAADAAPAAVHESESETIAKCLQDLKSADKDKRARAVLILGKYARNPVAQQATMLALEDPEAAIRRSALVALTERNVPSTARDKMLRMIADDDVHIRRIASSYIHEIMMGGAYFYFNSAPNNARNQLPADVQRIIRNAFSDSDAIVRKNMLAKFTYLRQFVRSSDLIPLLRDESRDVRALALTTLRRMMPLTQYIDATMHLVDDEDATIRVQMATTLGSMRSPESQKALEKLAKDKDYEVSTTALRSLFRYGQKELGTELVKRLDHPSIKSDTASRIIYELSIMGPECKPLLEQLMKHTKTSYRVTALQAYGNTFQQVDPTFLAGLLTDGAPSVRSTAASLLMRTQKLPDDVVDAVVTSDHADVRRYAMSIARRDPQRAEDVLMELLLDDDTEIRLQAISEICRRQFEGWDEILDETLDESDQKVLMRSLTYLCQAPHPNVRQKLLAFAQTTRNPQARSLILSRLPRNPTTIQRGTSVRPQTPYRVTPSPTTPRVVRPQVITPRVTPRPAPVRPAE
jgi:HEAT repeat protein